jgi:flagellar hook assembly protein FlgD
MAYTLPGADYVKIEIFDLFGRSIANLFNGKQTAGDQQMLWDGRDNAGNEVAPGFYIVRLTKETGTYSSRIFKSK